MSCCENEKLEFNLIRKEMREMESSLYKDIQDISASVAECMRYLRCNLPQTIEDYMRKIHDNGELADLTSGAILGDLKLLNARTKSMISVLEYGAHPGGFCDCSDAIQDAINAANKSGAAVYFPKGVYLISKTIKLNGCSLYGEVGNIFEQAGVVVECATKDFVAISQGDTARKSIMFDIKNIIVKNADVAFEIIYAINSVFERLYAVDCNTGYNIGNSNAVGCMFCRFENLYTSGCDYGVIIDSNEYFNNNQFINGFIEGAEIALQMKVFGGYGAVGNTFQNVEFRSLTGRGVYLTSCINTTFNECYFECGGNAIRTDKKQSTFSLNGCVFAQYKKDNKNGDTNIVYLTNAGAVTINNGVVFATDEYSNINFFFCENAATYSNFYIIKNIVTTIVGGLNGFQFFDDISKRKIKELAAPKKEQVKTTGTVTLNANESNKAVSFTFESPFDEIPPVFVATIRGATTGDVSYTFSERLATGGTLLVTNHSSSAISVSFSVYAKEV